MSNDGRRGNLLKGARVYLSGPMDFVASRAAEKKHGWRNRIGDFLRHLGVTVFDPWNKPEVRGFYEYGRENVDSTGARAAWTFEDSKSGAAQRARCSGQFWQTLHIDLRMLLPTYLYWSGGRAFEFASDPLNRVLSRKKVRRGVLALRQADHHECQP